MKYEMIRCDICGKEWEAKRKDLYPIVIEITTQGLNPLGGLRTTHEKACGAYCLYTAALFALKEVCEDCSRHIAEAAAKAITELKEGQP
jgi:hypothetical protein